MKTPLKSLLAAVLLAAACGRALAGESMESTSYRMPRNAADSGGDHWPTSAGGDSLKSALGEVAGSSASSAGYQIVPGIASMLTIPGPVTNLSGLDDVSISSVTLSWTAPGIDGGLGTLQFGATYFIHVASYTVPNPFALSNATWVFAAHGSAPGAVAQRGVTDLMPNTTYYTHLWVTDGYGEVSYASARATFTLLAKPVQLALEPFPVVYETSVTVTWVALPSAPPQASSETSEGYVVLASSTDWGALSPGGMVYSSATPSPAANTLTVGDGVPLEYCTTYYFRVGSLNWAGRPNVTPLPSTPTLRDFGVSQSTHDLNIGDVPLDYEVFMATSILVANTGSCPATFALRASITTPASPWSVDTSSGTDTMTVQAVFNATPPAAAAFTDEDKLTGVAAAATASRFAFGQDAVAVPRGGQRLMWFKVGMPRITSTEDAQDLNVTVEAREPTP